MSRGASHDRLQPVRVGIRVGAQYREMRFDSPRILIGRSLSTQEGPPVIDLSEDSSVSRRHAEIRWTGEGYTVTDLGSTNGTWINGERISPGQIRRLRDQDRIAVGRLSVLTINLSGGHDASSSPTI